jgi:5-methylcytosine-specific restriction protein A
VKLTTLKSRIVGMPARVSPQRVERIRGRTLQVIRTEHFRRNPCCTACLAEGVYTLATELDHIIPLFKGGSDSEANRQGLCATCHAAKTRGDLKDPGGWSGFASR